MKKRFLKPIKFIKKYEGKAINFTVYFNKHLNYKRNFKMVLSCDDDYTTIYSNATADSFRTYLTFCLFAEENKIVGCYLDSKNVLCINRSKREDIIIDLLLGGTPLLWME